jgi:hypothetical protein
MDTPADQWVYVAAPLFLYGVIVMGLFAWGFRDDLRNPLLVFFKSISTGLERVTGYPGWAMAGALSALWSLGTAAVGLYWDVAYHIDVGRDQELFTPSHTMIVIGLAGIVYSAAIAVLFATLDGAPVGVRVLGIRIPYSARALAALGAGGLAGFPLDNLWHEAYGIDVTLWSPTHLQLVLGGSLATIPTWLMLVEGRPAQRPRLLGRGILALTLGAILVGVSTVQGEFDFGVPQFQVIYLPILIAAAAGFTLVLARAALGPWGAVKAVVGFLVLRGLFGLLVSVPLNHTFPRFPLYLASALVVEAVARWWGTDDRLRYSLVAGVATATVGMVGELAWVQLSGWAQLNGNDVARTVLLVPAAAVAAALLGGALSRPARARRTVPAVVTLASVPVIVAVLLLPLPRNVGDVQAVIRLVPHGEHATVSVELDPPDAARRATAFGVVAWQGGGRVSAELDQVGPGRYVSSRPLPVSGRWKTTVGLQRGDEVMAAPVYFPADPEIQAPEVPALPERRQSFARNTTLLLREQHDGPTWPAVLGYGGLAAMMAVWSSLIAFTAWRLSEEPPGRSPGQVPSAPVRAAAPSGNGEEAERLRNWREQLARLRAPTGP